MNPHSYEIHQKTAAVDCRRMEYLAMRMIRCVLPTAALLCAALGVPGVFAQEQVQPVLKLPLAAVEASLPEAPVPAMPAAATPVTAVDEPTATAADPQDGQQSKRILFIIPNFRAVSVDAKLPPLSKGDKLKLFVSDSFDYSAFIYVGLLAGVQQADNSTPEFRQGAAGYGRYYWHAFADNTGGNLMTESVVPILTREDPRYYTLGRGGFVKRLGYSLGRLVITRPDGGGQTFNVSEIVGNAVAAGASNFYYPSPERTASKTADKWAMQIGLDGASNILKEFWPDISQAFTHHPSPPLTQP
jgi:hypothetical protein